MATTVAKQLLEKERPVLKISTAFWIGVLLWAMNGIVKDWLILLLYFLGSNQRVHPPRLQHRFEQVSRAKRKFLLCCG
jgi:hypothetical protein